MTIHTPRLITYFQHPHPNLTPSLTNLVVLGPWPYPVMMILNLVRGGPTRRATKAHLFTLTEHGKSNVIHVGANYSVHFVWAYVSAALLLCKCVVCVYVCVYVCNRSVSVSVSGQCHIPIDSHNLKRA